MNSLSMNGTVWLVRPVAAEPRALRRGRRVGRAGVLGRILGVTALALGLGVPLGSGRAPADPGRPRAASPTAAAITTAGKNGARMPAWPEAQRETASMPLPPAQPETVAAAPAWSIFDPEAASGAGFSKADPVATGSLKPDAFTQATSDQRSGWRDEEFSQVAVIDGRTLAVDGTRIRLAGLELPGADEVCRTLDGRLESCTARAATQLELLTRWRKLSCHYRLGDGAAEAVGHCRVGTSDLSERLLKTGFARRTAEAAQSAPRLN
jgi:endonuclease YncB( thermonuclease family)